MIGKLHPKILRYMLPSRSLAFAKLLFISLIICTSRYSIAQSVVKVEVTPLERSSGECRLSNFAETIEYIPLETNDKCLIGQIVFFDVSENYIVTYCIKSESIYLFHRNGHFICQVSNKGDGPKDFLTVYGLFIDEKSKRIIIIDGFKQKQLSYDLTGGFINSEPINAKESIGLYRRLHNGFFFISTPNYNGNVPFAYEIRDVNFKLITENIKTVYYERGPTINMMGVPFHKYSEL